MPLFKRRRNDTTSGGTSNGDPREVFPSLDWPFSGNRFPSHLGAVVQRTVLDGHLPAREVVHTDENRWIVGDGVNDPNLPGACVVGHLAHVIEFNSSVADLADLPLGWRAIREAPGTPWQRESFAWLEDDETFEPLG